MDVVPARYMLITTIMTVPGWWATWAPFSAAKKINIAGMQLGGRSAGKDHGVQVDVPVPPSSKNKCLRADAPTRFWSLWDRT